MSRQMKNEIRNMEYGFAAAKSPIAYSVFHTSETEGSLQWLYT